MTDHLAGKVAVITGSTRGFGYAVSKELLQAGARVVLSGRSQPAVSQAVDSLKAYGTVSGYACDVSVPDRVYGLARSTLREYGALDIWVNNAGFTPDAGGVIDFSPDVALDLFKTNCLGVLNGTQAALDIMLPRRQGTLVNLYGRGSDLKPASPSGLYGTTKAWVTSFTRTLAAEQHGAGIQVIGFSPGMMLTDLLAVKQVVGEQVKETMKSMPMVLKALARPPEVPARELVKLLETNRKEFVEYRFMRGWRAVSMIASLLWMQANPARRPAPVDYPVTAPYRPLIEKE